MVNLKSVKTQFSIFLAAFALYLSVKDKDALFLLKSLIAVVSCVTFETVFSYLKNKKIELTESPVISGLIIGLVFSSDEPWWMFVLVCLFAIGSKYLIRLKGKHLFNPAAFGVFLATVLFGASTQWKGTYLWYILVPAGFYFIYKIRKIELLTGYALTALLLFGIQAIIQKVPLVNIFGYMSYFYIFVMLIEPKTTPIKRRGKFIFGASVAVLIFVLTEMGARFDVELCSLLVMNLSVPILNKLA